MKNSLNLMMTMTESNLCLFLYLHKKKTLHFEVPYFLIPNPTTPSFSTGFLLKNFSISA
jgi:hypothetical protein